MGACRKPDRGLSLLIQVSLTRSLLYWDTIGGRGSEEGSEDDLEECILREKWGSEAAS